VIGSRFALLAALLPLFGCWIVVFPSVRALPRAARFASAVTAGVVTLTALMFAMAVAGVRWSLPLLLVPALASLGMAIWFRRPSARSLPATPRELAILALAVTAVLLVAATTLAGAATSFDLLLFWGAKGQQFALARTIDVGFLRDPRNALMHSDYPPLLPLVYAWTMLGGSQLDWFGVIATAPLLLLTATAAVWGITRSAAMTALYAAMFGVAFIDNNIAGNAEPMLLLFETVAVGAILWKVDALAAIALAGAVLTKVEGAAFMLVVLPLARRRAFRIAIAPVVALGAWLAFCAHHGLLDTYRPHAALSSPLAVFRPLIQQASMGVAYVPWIALLLVIALGRVRAALPAILAAMAYLVFLTMAWTGVTDVATEIAWSARRVLLTPLLLLFFAAVASRPGPETEKGGLAAALHGTLREV
jgi:hypothetical protein